MLRTKKICIQVTIENGKQTVIANIIARRRYNRLDRHILTILRMLLHDLTGKLMSNLRVYFR